MKKLIGILLALALIVGGASFSVNAEWPQDDVEVIVPWDAGGATDVLFRAVADQFSEYADGHDLIVNNVPGGGAAIGYGEGAAADADGYTLTAAVNPLVTRAQMGDAPYEPVEDYRGVAQLVDNPSYLLVREDDERFDDLNDFMEYAEENPGILTIANGGAGGGNHLVALSFENEFDVEFNHIPFEGGAPSITATVGGHTDAVIASSPEGFENVEADELEFLAIFDDERIDEFPEAPTAKEQGYEFEAGMWRGLIAPAGTEDAAVENAAEIAENVLNDEDFVETAEDMGQNLVFRGPEEFDEHIENEFERYEEIITEYGLGDLYD